MLVYLSNCVARQKSKEMWSMEQERDGKGECESSEVNVLLRCKQVRRGSLILLLEHTTTRQLVKGVTGLQLNKGRIKGCLY